jgi:hypothetical protein
MKHIGIVGTRSRNTQEDLEIVKDAFFEIYEFGDIIVSGGCRSGGDRFAEQIARDNGIPILIFFPDWKKYGKKAGFIRNVDIADASDVLIACVAKDKSKGKGTEHTCKQFRYKKPNNDIHRV